MQPGLCLKRKKRLTYFKDQQIFEETNIQNGKLKKIKLYYFTLGEIDTIQGRERNKKTVIRLLRYTSDDTGYINKIRPGCFIKAITREQ